MSIDTPSPQDTRLGGFGHSADEDAQIALESRIIHVADAFVAMTLDRPYRRALTRDETIAELVRHRGTQFDPAVVHALLALEARDDMAAAA